MKTDLKNLQGQRCLNKQKKEIGLFPSKANKNGDVNLYYSTFGNLETRNLQKGWCSQQLRDQKGRPVECKMYIVVD